MESPQMATLGLEVRSRREAAGMSMEELCDVAGIGRSTLHRVENGEIGKPNPSTFAHVLHVLGFKFAEVEAMLTEVEDPRWHKRLELAMSAGPDARSRARAQMVGAAGVDIVAVDNGNVCRISVTAGGDECLRKILDTLMAGGWDCSRPIM